MSRKGNCWDNACIENFLGLFKSETIKQQPDRTVISVDEMKKLDDYYACWSHNQRIQKTRLLVSDQLSKAGNPIF